jgi:transcriptional regulator with XRE-family HTH domain
VAKPKKTHLGDEASELIFARKLLGEYMRLARENAFVSQRYVELVTGVSNSEISKIENGNQECRLESFVRVCAALGVPWGYVLDQVVMANPLPYEEKIAFNPLFQKLEQNNPEMAPILTLNLAVIASFCAHLIRCSNPVERAMETEYPDESARTLFLRYAKAVSDLSAPGEKIQMIHRWRENPLGLLKAAGFLENDFILKFLAALIGGKVGRKSELRDMVLDAANIRRDVPVWMPFIPKLLFTPDSEDSGKKLDLTKAESAANNSDVKSPLPAFLERMKKASSATGKKSELAKFLGAPLASVSRWLSGEREPGGEITLKMLKWVEQQERQK